MSGFRSNIEWIRGDLLLLDLYDSCAYNKEMSYTWNPKKAAGNFTKHGVRFADAVAVFEDESSLWLEDTRNYDEQRFAAIGMDHLNRILTVVFAFRGDHIRLISARQATKREKADYQQERQ